MALLKTVKKETSTIIDKLGIGSHGMLGANFRTYGASMGIHEFNDYLQYARRIYREAMNNPGGFTVLDLPNGKKAVDFQGKIRGVYDQFGEPEAFFKPDYQKLGFRNYQEELEEFKAAVTTAASVN